ncbi:MULTISPECIES: tetratricopeptide repeat protein [unclassified Pigmentiphaga]|uniref:tetratricopeptide repeat protein n=1 Tax=unclassified Pigmentiphaga TaxID=2626614 RepID=UPI001404BF7B|nr:MULTISPECIES: tetratricopeptide repeat protein [unclassified Pigmentiphaga]
MPARMAAWLVLGGWLAVAAGGDISGARTGDDAAAAYEMARHYGGLTGAALDRQKSFDYMSKAAELGHGPAQVDLAFMYYNGNDRVPKDLSQAFRQFRKAAAGGSVIAQCMLGDFYGQGLGGAPRDDKEAFKWHRLAASGNDRCSPKSQYALYQAYAAGRGVARDTRTAVAWLERAAQAGNPVAQARLGRAYLEGDLVPIDLEQGKAWLKKSREGVAPHDDEEEGAHDH